MKSLKNSLGKIFGTIVLSLSALPASADVIMGGQIEYTGGEVTVQVMDASAAYHSFLGLYLFDGTDWVQVELGDLGENHDTGESTTFDPSDWGYSPGDELVFGISVFRGGSHDDPTNPLGIFVMGPGERNPDGIEHAVVDTGDGSTITVGFEDLWGGGDLDYNDNVFSFFGGVAVVPEPLTLFLMGIGLLAISARRKKVIAA